MTRIPHCHRYIFDSQPRTRARKPTNLAHAPNYACTTRSLLYALLLLFLLLLARLCISVIRLSLFLFLSPSFPLSRFLLYHLLLALSPFYSNHYFSLNTTTENMAYLCFKDGHTNRDTLDVFCCLGSCLLHHYIPLSFASFF